MSPEEMQGHFEDEARGYFEFLAKVGLTKHIGSMADTRELLDLCHVERGQRVLEVGCGVGATVTYLANSLGCRVVGADLLEKMVRQARERAAREGALSHAGFADASFDAVIMESVNVFFDDKREAMREYLRVTRPGGYVGITEMTWLETPPEEVAAYYERIVYARALEAEGWKALMEEVGLEDVTGQAHRVDFSEEARGRIERYGSLGMGRVMVWRGAREEPVGRLPPRSLPKAGCGRR